MRLKIGPVEFEVGFFEIFIIGFFVVTIVGLVSGN